MKCIFVFFSFFIASCACHDSRGCSAVNGFGNTPNQSQMVREGRDCQTYESSKMPLPPSKSDNQKMEMHQPQIDTANDSLTIDIKLDLNKI